MSRRLFPVWMAVCARVDAWSKGRPILTNGELDFQRRLWRRLIRNTKIGRPRKNFPINFVPYAASVLSRTIVKWFALVAGTLCPVRNSSRAFPGAGTESWIPDNAFRCAVKLKIRGGTTWHYASKPKTAAERQY